MRTEHPRPASGRGFSYPVTRGKLKMIREIKVGLRFSDALRLSWQNIARHKKRSAVIILTMSVFFGALSAVLSAASGLENTIIQLSANQTNDAAYLAVLYDESKISNATHSSMISGIDDLSGLSYEVISPDIKESDLAKIQERVAQYGGEIIGYTWYWQIGYPYNVVSSSVAEDFLDQALDTTPKAKVPALMPNGWKLNEGWVMGEIISPTLYQVGEIPMTQEEYEHPTLPGLNPLNIILGQVHGNTLSNTFFLVDDGSEKIDNYIIEQAKICISKFDGCTVLNTHPYKKIVVKFSDMQQAVNFATPEQKMLDVPLYAHFPFVITDLFGSTVETALSIFNVRVMLLPIILFLFVVALVITTFSFAHLIDQDAATVALYRSMGASTSNIYLIYLLYLFELSILTIFASTIIAIFIVGILWIFNHQALAQRLQEFYYINNAPQITLLGFDNLFWLIVAAILCLAPLSLLCSLRHFSARNIAKKLRED